MPRFLAAVLMLSAIFPASWVYGAPGTARERFEKYVGKYPDALFKGEPDVNRRLRTMLGANYTLFTERFQLGEPIENSKGILVAKGCKAHECGDEVAILLINLSDGKLHCAIKSDTYSDKVKTFSEDRDRFPSAALKSALGE
jgi:hypothetical protein